MDLKALKALDSKGYFFLNIRLHIKKKSIAYGFGLVSPGGGIGRHARLRIWYRKVCGFDSLPGHFILRPQFMRAFSLVDRM